MKNDQYRLSKLKYQLEEMKRNNCESVVKKLSPLQKEYVENLGYAVIPWIYEIDTQRIINYSYVCGLLKEIHRASCRGQRKLYKKVNNNQIKILNRAGIQFRVLNYKIFPQAKRS